MGGRVRSSGLGVRSFCALYRVAQPTCALESQQDSSGPGGVGFSGGGVFIAAMDRRPQSPTKLLKITIMCERNQNCILYVDATHYTAVTPALWYPPL